VPALPVHPSLEWLRKAAKTRLAKLRQNNPGAKLADAQFELAKEYGFASWRALKANIDTLTVEGQLIESARTGNVERLKALLDEYPDKLRMKVPPYEASLLFPATQSGNLDAVDLLLERGLDVNYRESGDNTYALHWVAAPTALRAEVRLYDHLFVKPDPDDVEPGETYLANLNPDSLKVVMGVVEPGAASAAPGTRYQFERLGYFCVDTDAAPGKPVFNRTVTLRDTWAKIEKASRPGE